MLKEFEKIMEGLIPRGETALFAVSGGIDSMCMAELAYRCGCRMAVAHCNFHLRGEESDGDEALVREWAESRGIPFHKADFNTEEYAGEHQESIEMAARSLRYSWFADLCDKNGYAAVAVAHNANDNIETMLLNLLRGTGLKGITGMRSKSPLPVSGSCDAYLIRPLLGFSRDRIESFVTEEGIVYRNDHTNSETVYKRNKLRHNVLPVFGEINPSFIRTISEEMRVFSGEHSIAEDYYDRNYRQVCLNTMPGEILRIDTEALMKITHWEYILYRLIGDYGFRGRLLDQIRRLLLSGETVSGKTFNAQGYSLVTLPGKLVLKKAEGMPNAVLSESDCCIIVRTPGLYTMERTEFETEIVDSEDNPVALAKRLANDGCLVADSEVLELPFLVRGWRNGDWMRPLGMRGTRKLSDIFSDLKLGIEDKARALVIVVPGMDGNSKAKAGERVAAVCGYASGSVFCRVDDSVKVTASTSRIVKLKIRPPYLTSKM